MNLVQGKVWKFEDNINTNLLMPTFTYENVATKVPEEQLKNYCMYTERPDFSKNVKRGDVVVGGKNFGCGSSRPAAKNLLALGISCVLAESVAAIFFRNSINLGLPVVSIHGVSALFREGDIAQVNLSTGKIENLTAGGMLRAQPVHELLMRILESGGIIPYLKKEASEGRLFERSIPPDCK
jgi:3-isopropylmalate/(R)-2-methylmalate dehydratase small subunit